MSDERRPDAAPADPRVDAAWRKVSRDEPPAVVDATILAAARGAARQTPWPRTPPAREAWWRRWQPMAAAAGVVGLAFVLVQMLPRNEPLQSPAAPTPQPLPESAARQSTAESRAAVPASPAPAAPSAPSAPAAPAELVAPSAAAAPATEAPQKAVRRELAGNGVSADMATATTADAGMQPAEAWVRLIVDLHAAGDDAAAAAELRAFRAAYPDADSRLPEPLRAWAATVTPPAAP